MPRIPFNCIICQKSFLAWPSAIQKGKRFCSKQCHGVYRSTHPNRGNFKKGQIPSEETRKKIGDAHRGEKNCRYSGGKSTNKSGYVVVATPQGRRYEHRLVMEKHLARPLLSNEVVHHENGNRSDNRIDNLKLYSSHKEHAQKHHPYNSNTFRRCYRCHETLELSSKNFYRDKNATFGFGHCCKKCLTESRLAKK